MPSLVEGEDRQTVKRTVPKASNKIHAAGVARLYIATGGRQKWTYTGLQGAVVLANDLVGHTYWIKLVDVSPANRGVIWDQEIYDTFQYNQDRVFFHSFELEGCMAGLSFADDKEAKKFKQKVDDREKNAHKNTKARPFGAQAGQAPSGSQANGKSHGILGGFGSLLHRDRQTSAPQAPAQSIIPPKEVTIAPRTHDGPAKDHGLGNIDPSLLDELLTMGITEDQLSEHAEFIKMWVAQRKSTAPSSEKRQKPPPPPAPVASSLSPQTTGDTTSSRKGPPPAPPQPRRAGAGPTSTSPAREESPPAAAGASKRFNFKAPPPLVGAGKFADDAKAAPSPRHAPAAAEGSHSGPQLPSRPPKMPLNDSESSTRLVPPPPPAQSERQVPPPPPARNSGPPPPPARGPAPGLPSRDRSHSHAVPPPVDVAPPPLPPKIPNASEDHSFGPPPPPRTRGPRSPASPPSLPSRDTHVRNPSLPTGRSSMESRAVPPPPSSHAPHAAAHAPPPAPPWPSSSSTSAPAPPSRSEPTIPPPPPAPSKFEPPPPPSSKPSKSAQPAPPPMPSRNQAPVPPPMPSSSGPPPPPPPMPSGSGPPPPPMPSSTNSDLEPATANAPPLPAVGGQRDGLLSDIRGGAKLKKVSEAEKRDRSAAAVPGGDTGSSNNAAGTTTGASSGADQGGLAGALASALAARKSKVSQSDDEDDKDDW